MARPTKYDPDYHPAKAYEFCAEYGLTDQKLARLFDVDKATINRWKKDFPEFCDSLRAGKDEFDSDEIEKSLLRRAKGFNYTETTKEPDKEGKMVTTRTLKRYVVADTPAIRLWLINRRSGRWADKQDVNLSGSMTMLAPEPIKKKNG